MAYALIALVQILEQDQHHLNLADIKPQVKSFLQEARRFRDQVERFYSRDRGSKGYLDWRIKDVVRKAEDILESHITSRILSDFSSMELDLAGVLDEFNSINLMIYKAEHSSLLVPSRSFFAGSVDIRSIEERVTSLTPVGLRVIPISEYSDHWGLLIQLYSSVSIATSFIPCAWVNLWFENDVRGTLLALLESLGVPTCEMLEESNYELGNCLYSILTGTRYLIVVDDLFDSWQWNWGEMRWFFPDEFRGCLVFVITREGAYARPAYDLRKSESGNWKLLQVEVFGQGNCPPELEEIGKQIAELCSGPKEITLIAGLLSVSTKTKQFWELVARSAKPHLDSQVDVLSLCYDFLPHSLKPCFLYVGAISHGYEVHASKILKLWIAEGLVEPTDGISLERTAEVYLAFLIGSNLVSVSQTAINGKVKAVQMHDSLTEFCQNKASEDAFLCFKCFDARNFPDGKETVRRVSLHPLAPPITDPTLLFLARSFLCIGHASLRLAPAFLGLRLLRVLDIFQLEFYQFPKEILQLVLLRYLALSCHSDLPKEISRLRNLQILIIRRLPSSRAFSLPSALWELTQLTQIKCKETCIWYLPRNDTSVIFLENLQTLSNIHVSSLSEEFLRRIPNVRKLGIFCNVSLRADIGLDCLQNLETLKCSSLLQVTRNFLPHLKYPRSLKKLKLSCCKIPIQFMFTIGSMPHLKQLKLQTSEFIDIELKATDWEPRELELGPTEAEWVPEQRGFLQLRSLVMEELNLVHWKADSTHFPRLQHLVIRGCCSMTEIPQDIGRIQTLELIEVDESSPSVLASARQILAEQRSLGNDLFQLHILSRNLR